jgi:hypothetical protein
MNKRCSSLSSGYVMKKPLVENVWIRFIKYFETLESGSCRVPRKFLGGFLFKFHKNPRYLLTHPENRVEVL